MKPQRNEILLPRDIENLKRERNWMTANRSADLAVDDKETRELLWNALDECLRKAAEEETKT